ncbi:MAG: peptidoglycan-binding protein LysM [Chromatiales bacterium]|nr:peptidoglycan-binding protein LysM [Chromatiales bacterium]
MQFWEFGLSLGRKLFKKGDDEATSIQKHIEEDNPGVKDLKVAFNDGVVSISGEADSVEAMEKAVLMAGNVKGVKQVNAAGVVHPTPATEIKVEMYQIKSGDTLSAIAKRYYGKASLYPRIFEANREVIKNPDLIFVGQIIRIPLD